eukprot:scaffold29745_cov48-Prasinocladus_malaysianus.AAC.1
MWTYGAVMTIHGIGKVSARTIVDGRPFRDLASVGLRRDRLKALTLMLIVASPYKDMSQVNMFELWLSDCLQQGLAREQ